ncbi:MAG: hypothetical protein P1U39_08085 [Legionellaceae bacterium]|nr:hypothetical protein [Legionellaceae bacterium]
MPKRIFQNQVTPFVGSISGVMLMQLKVMAILLRRRELPFRAQSESSRNVQLELYIKSFVSYMIYNAGGHSLHEYLDVLNLPIVQDEFQSLSGFSKIELRYLFQKTNVAAFEKSMEQTITYNNNMIQKKSLHQELKERVPEINTDIDQETKTPTHYSIFTPIQIEETAENKPTDMIISVPEPHKVQANYSIFSPSVNQKDIPEPPHHQYDIRSRKRFNPDVLK